MSIIIKGMDMPKDGLYNVMNGKFFKYKSKGGTVRQYDIIEIPKTIICENLLRDIEYEVHKDEFDY